MHLETILYWWTLPYIILLDTTSYCLTVDNTAGHMTLLLVLLINTYFFPSQSQLFCLLLSQPQITHNFLFKWNQQALLPQKTFQCGYFNQLFTMLVKWTPELERIGAVIDVNYTNIIVSKIICFKPFIFCCLQKSKFWGSILISYFKSTENGHLCATLVGQPSCTAAVWGCRCRKSCRKSTKSRNAGLSLRA